MAPERAPPRGARDDGRLADAVASFIDALELPRDVRAHPDLADTPRRVAEAWRDDLLDGYRQDPAAILAESMPAAGHDLVALTGIDFHSMCPHHLLPSRGVAHVAYVPGERVVGFGQLARLVDCFAHRLVLEEDLARSIAGALAEHLGARGAACVLDAEQACVTVRGERRRDARAHAQVFVGALARDHRLQQRFLAAVAQHGAASPRSGAAKRGSASGAKPARERASGAPARARGAKPGSASSAPRGGSSRAAPARRRARR